MKRSVITNGSRIDRAAVMSLSILVLVLAAAAQSAYATDLFLNDGVTLEPQGGGTTDTIKLRKLAVPDLGFRSGVFKWTPAKNAWVKEGVLTNDGYYEWLGVFKHADSTGVGFELAGIGTGIDAVAFTTPKGVSYDLAYGETVQGIDVYKYGTAVLPLNQTDFGNGKYVLTYTLKTGKKVVRTCYLNAAYPTAVKIAYPATGATGVPLTPSLKWSALGAARYEVAIWDTQSNQEVYRVYLDDALETSLSHTLPSGVLQAGGHYRFNLNAISPMVNCGQRGVEMSVEFTTAGS